MYVSDGKAYLKRNIFLDIPPCSSKDLFYYYYKESTKREERKSGAAGQALRLTLSALLSDNIPPYRVAALLNRYDVNTKEKLGGGERLVQEYCLENHFPVLPF